MILFSRKPVKSKLKDMMWQRKQEPQACQVFPGGKPHRQASTKAT